MFWCSNYNTYIDCDGGDLVLKQKLQEDEQNSKKLSQSAVICAPPTTSQGDETNKEKEVGKVMNMMNKKCVFNFL